MNSAPKAHIRWKRTFTDKELAKQIPISMEVSGSLNNPLTLKISDGSNDIFVKSSEILQESRNAPLSKEDVQRVLGALGGTPYELNRFSASLPNNAFIHIKVLKVLKRDGIAALDLKRESILSRDIKVADVEALLNSRASSVDHAQEQVGELHVLIRDYSQVDALEDLPCSTVYLDFEFGKEYGPALERIRSFGKRCGIATTRILKPGEMGHLDYIRRLKPDFVLVRNLGALHYFKELGFPSIGDFSLNVANSLTAQWMMDKGLSRYCPSYDLNREQLMDLISASDGSKAEITIHQYMPSFHMEHCVFAAFLSNGTSFKDCGKPCEKHRVELKGPDGLLHPLKPDAECRNTMFHGVPQSASRLIPDLLKLGVRNFRLEALFEDMDQLRRKVEGYSALIKGEASAEDLYKRIGVVEKYGISEGQLYNIRRYKDRKG